MAAESTRDGIRGEIAGGRTTVSLFAPRTNALGGAMLHRRLATLTLATLAALSLLVLPAAAAGAQDEALVRLAHFAPGLRKGDVYVAYVNGRLRLKDVPFKTVSDYLKVRPGRFQVEVRKSGQAADAPPVVSATVTLKGGRAYTVAVFGQLTSVRAMLLDDDMSRPASGKSRFRFIQALPGNQAVDLASDGGVLFSGAQFPSASGYVEVPAGRADLELRKAGSGELLAPSRNVNLPKGSVSTLVVVGGIGEKLELLEVRDSAAAAAAPAGGVATGAGGTAPTGGRRFAVLLLMGAGIAAAAGFVVQQRRSAG
jgi:uncharacterized protein DUF4397